MNCYILGLAVHPASANCALRLEEMVYHTARAALDDARVTRRQLDHVTLGACDELDGRSISSMLMAMPAGGYELDEIKVTDSGATALCLEMARIQSEEFELGMVSSWCKSSKTDVETVMRLRGEPFYTRPFGINMTVSDALFAQSVADEFGIAPDEINERVVRNYERAAGNPRGMQHPVPTVDQVAQSGFESTPMRRLQRAPLSDGAVSMVVASERWLDRHPGHRALARLSGIAWATDAYRLGRERLRSMHSARTAFERACGMAGIGGAAQIDVVELESQTGYHEAAYVRALGLDDHPAISPSGGAFAQNPLFCTGLACAAEAVLQVSGRAGPVQCGTVQRAVAHSAHGYAQQGNVFMVFEWVGDERA